MLSKTIAFGTVLSVALAGCGGDDTSAPTPDASPDVTQDSGPGMDVVTQDVGQDVVQGDAPDGSAFPTAPTLGAQIDRIGRPGINTALTDPFWDDGVQTVDQHHAKQDTYNQVTDPTKWGSTVLNGTKTVLDVFKANLAGYDGLDTGLATPPNTCGNQLAFGGPLGAAYTTLATALADDELFVDTSTATCAQYLAVEAKALGVTITDCGGRRLSYNVIDTTYNALVIGALTGPVTNGVTKDGDGNPSDTTFPYLGPPN